MAYSPAVEQWRPLVEQYFAPQDVDKALHVIQYESGGNPSAYGDGGHSVGLFQHNTGGLASGRSLQALQDPAANIRLAAEAVYGSQGWRPWGENNLYQGKPFGSLGAHPYNNSITPPNTGGAGMTPPQVFPWDEQDQGAAAPSVRFNNAGEAFEWDRAAQTWVRAPQWDGSRTAPQQEYTGPPSVRTDMNGLGWEWRNGQWARAPQWDDPKVAKPAEPNVRSFSLGSNDYMVVDEDSMMEIYRVVDGRIIKNPTYQGAMPNTGLTSGMGMTGPTSGGMTSQMSPMGTAPGGAWDFRKYEDGSVGIMLPDGRAIKFPPGTGEDDPIVAETVRKYGFQYPQSGRRAASPQNQGWSTYNGQRVRGQIDFNQNDPNLPPVPEASANAGATSNSIYWNAQPRIPKPGEDDTQPGFYTDRSKVGPGATPYHKSDGPKFGSREYTQMLANYARGGDPDRSSMFPNTRQPVSRTGLATYQRMAEASQDFAQRTPYERGEVDHLGNRWLANGGSMISSDPIAFVNMRTKRPIAVSSEYGQPERIDVTPMDNTPAMMATGGTMFSGVSSPDRWRRSGASNDGDWESRDRPRISYPEEPLPDAPTPPATEFTNWAPPPPPRVAPDATTPGAPTSPPLPTTPPAPIDPMQDAIRRAYEARQRAKMAYRYSMAGLPSPYGVSLSELPPGLFWEDDLPAQLPPDHPSNQPPPGTTPSPTPNQPNVPAIGPGEHPAEYINRLVRGGYFSTETAAGQWYQQQPKTPKVGDTPIPNDPLAFLAAKLFGDRRAA